MAKKILWLDNDAAYVRVYVKELQSQTEPYEVTPMSAVSEAEACLDRETYDLLILDVMIPTKNEAEEQEYPPEETEHGLRMGYCFYKKHRRRLADAGTKVFVLTARIDEPIKQDLMKEGLTAEQIMMKADVSGLDEFLAKVEEMIGG